MWSLMSYHSTPSSSTAPSTTPAPPAAVAGAEARAVGSGGAKLKTTDGPPRNDEPAIGLKRKGARTNDEREADAEARRQWAKRRDVGRVSEYVHLPPPPFHAVGRALPPPHHHAQPVHHLPPPPYHAVGHAYHHLLPPYHQAQPVHQLSLPPYHAVGHAYHLPPPPHHWSHAQAVHHGSHASPFHAAVDNAQPVYAHAYHHVGYAQLSCAPVSHDPEAEKEKRRRQKEMRRRQKDDDAESYAQRSCAPVAHDPEAEKEKRRRQKDDDAESYAQPACAPVAVEKQRVGAEEKERSRIANEKAEKERKDAKARRVVEVYKRRSVAEVEEARRLEKERRQNAERVKERRQNAERVKERKQKEASRRQKDDDAERERQVALDLLKQKEASRRQKEDDAERERQAALDVLKQLEKDWMESHRADQERRQRTESEKASLRRSRRSAGIEALRELQGKEASCQKAERDAKQYHLARYTDRDFMTIHSKMGYVLALLEYAVPAKEAKGILDREDDRIIHCITPGQKRAPKTHEETEQFVTFLIKFWRYYKFACSVEALVAEAKEIAMEELKREKKEEASFDLQYNLF